MRLPTATAFFAAFFSAALALFAAAASPARAAEEAGVAAREWSFSGIFGTFDRAALRRGFQVYKDICTGCHSLNLVAYRNLEQIGFSADEVKSIAAQSQVTDGPNDQGQMYQRPARASDHFVPPFANEVLARLANNGALPPDLSLITKARKGGPDYLYAVLTGYTEPPAGVTVADGMYYNAAFPGHQIAMPQPLADGAVEFADGTPATVEQMASDVTTFLDWAADPKLEDRKRMGVKVMMYLLLLTAMLYAVKRKVWRDVH
jgi:ubiquinol-cytochrome c reductase cytochrome c1 subunit